MKMRVYPWFEMEENNNTPTPKNMNNPLNNFVVGRFETESDRNTCIKFLRDSLITYENLINKYTRQGYTMESSGALREATDMQNAFRKA